LPTAEKYSNLVRESAVFHVGAGEVAGGVGELVSARIGDLVSARWGGEARLHLDLWKTNRNQLLMAGLLPEHIELPGICTSCEKERFFSHRGEYGKTGRFPSILALRNK